MFCFTCAGRFWPVSVVSTTAKRRSFGCPSFAGVVDVVRELSTRGSLAAAAAQVQSIKKRVLRRKLVLPEDTGQRHGVSEYHINIRPGYRERRWPNLPCKRECCSQFWCVSAFSTAEEFRLEELYATLCKSNTYEPTCLYYGSDNEASEWRRLDVLVFGCTYLW